MGEGMFTKQSWKPPILQEKSDKKQSNNYWATYNIHEN